MTLQVYTLALGNFRDDTSGNNYAANTPVYILNSGGTLADIFRDQAGAQPIAQDGLNNISDAYGEFTFYVNSGQYISRVAGRDRLINVVGSDYFDSRVDDAVEQITQQTMDSRGFRVVGTFADGFTYELFNDVGIDADGNSWIYVGAGAPNKVVSAGTVPSVSAGYEQVTFNDAINMLRQDLANPDKGAAMVGFKQDGLGSVPRTLVNKGSDVISPKDFGAVGDGVADDTQALQRFFDALSTDRIGIASWVGRFKISGRVVIEDCQNSTIYCDASLISAFSSESEMLSIGNSNYLNLTGQITVIGSGGAEYTSRGNGVGISIDRCRRINIDQVRVESQKYKAVSIVNGAGHGGGNSSLWSIGKLIALDIGSGREGTVRGLSREMLSRSDEGGSGSFQQSSILTLDSVPSGVQQFDLVKVGDSLCSVVEVVSSNQIRVEMWPDLDFQSGAIHFYIGGALYTLGGDTSVGHVGTLDALGCSVGYNAMSLYPAVVDNFVGQANGVNIRVGRTKLSSVGGYIGQAYFETSFFDVVRSATTVSSFKISQTIGLDPSKLYGFSPRRSDNSTADSLTALSGVSIGYKGSQRNARRAVESQSIDIDFEPKQGLIETVRANNATVNIKKISPSEQIVWGSVDSMLFATGTGAKGRPVGEIKFVPPAGESINGSAPGEAVTFSDFSGPALFYIISLGNNHEVIRSIFNNSSEINLNLTWPLLASGGTQSIEVVYPGAKLGAYIQIARTSSLMGTTMWGQVTETGNITIWHHNPTEADVTLGSGQMTLRMTY